MTSDLLYRRTFVGRSIELSQLQNLYDRAVDGDGALAFVVGEPGIGKTALSEQLGSYVSKRGGKALVGHCYEEGSLSLPYLAIIEAMQAYIRKLDDEGLRSNLGTAAADVARIVPDVAERLRDVELRPASDPESDRWRLLQGVSSFLRNASASQPLLIVLEDLHWADRGTLDLLLHIARNLQGARVLIVGTYRDVEVDRSHPLSAALAEMGRAGNFQRLRPRGLTIDEVQGMIASALEREVAQPFAELIHQQTEGNPLFVQEMLRYLIEEGLVSEQDGVLRWVGDEPLAGRTPEGLRDVIGKRLSRLSSECNRLLAIAAVIGRDFRFDTLRAVAGIEENALVSALEEATRVGVLEEAAHTGVITYRFTHAFFRQMLYEELSAPRRLRFHQEVARALEAQYATRRQDHAVELAEHFANSTERADLTKAVEYGEMAAHRAMSVFDYGEAVRLLEKALDVQDILDPDNLTKRCDLLLALGNAVGPSGDSRRGYEVVAPEAYELAEQLGDTKRLSQASNLAIQSFERHIPSPGSVQLYRDWAERANRYAQPGTTSTIVVDMALATIKYEAREYSGARQLRISALKLARALEDEGASLRALRTLLAQHFGPQHDEELLQLTEEFMLWPREGASARELTGCLFHAGRLLMFCGKPEEAERAWRELQELAERTQDANAQIYHLAARMLMGWFNGHLEEALIEAARMLRLSEELGVTAFGRTYARGYGVRTPLALGRIEAMVDFPLETSGRYIALEALVLAHAGRVNEARAILVDFVGQPGIGSLEDETPSTFLVYLLEASILLGECQAAELLATRLAGVASLPSFLGFTCIARHLGAAAVLNGNPSAARSFYTQALEVCEKVHFRPEAALTCLQLAELLIEHYPDERSAAIEHLDFAIAEFVAMGMQPSLARALRLRGRRRPVALPKIPSYPDGLSGREVEVLRLVAGGRSNPQIADELVISRSTVQNHVSSILTKASLANRAEAAVYAERHNLT